MMLNASLLPGAQQSIRITLLDNNSTYEDIGINYGLRKSS